MFFAQMLFLGYGWVWTAYLCLAFLEGGIIFKNNPSYAIYGLITILLLMTIRRWAAAEFDLARRPRALVALGATLKKPHTLEWLFSKINLALASFITLAGGYFAVLDVVGNYCMTRNQP